MNEKERPAAMSRRKLLRSAGIAGMAAVLPRVPRGLEAKAAEDNPPDPAVQGAIDGGGVQGHLLDPDLVPRLTFTVAEAEILSAILDRMLPTDEYGPGAREAGTLRYLDRALGGPLSANREAYGTGLAAVDRFARGSRGAPFTELAPEEQDRVLFDVAHNGAGNIGVGFVGPSSAFYNMVRAHAWQGTFGDPSYGGNANFVGWSLLRYPGVRMGVTAEMQRQLEAGELAPQYRSAYAYAQFHLHGDS